MGGPTVHEFEEGEDFLDSLTRDQLEQAAEDYDENKQVGSRRRMSPRVSHSRDTENRCRSDDEAAAWTIHHYLHGLEQNHWVWCFHCASEGTGWHRKRWWRTATMGSWRW